MSEGARESAKKCFRERLSSSSGVSDEVHKPVTISLHGGGWQKIDGGAVYGPRWYGWSSGTWWAVGPNSPIGLGLAGAGGVRRSEVL